MAGTPHDSPRRALGELTPNLHGQKNLDTAQELERIKPLLQMTSPEKSRRLRRRLVDGASPASQRVNVTPTREQGTKRKFHEFNGSSGSPGPVRISTEDVPMQDATEVSAAVSIVHLISQYLRVLTIF